MKRLLLIAIGVAAFAAMPSYAAKSLSLCKDSERVLWNCAVAKSSKIASLCSSQMLDATTGYVQYRFGRPGAVELTFPSTLEKTQTRFLYSRYTRPLVTYLRIHFKTNGYAYAMEDTSDESEGFDADEKAATNGSWIVVTNPQGKETRMRCVTDSRGSLTKLEDVLPNEDFLP